MIILEDAALEHFGVLAEAITVTIALSVLLHGLTAMPLTVRYVRWFGAHSAGLEGGSAPHVPDRRTWVAPHARTPAGSA